MKKISPKILWISLVAFSFVLMGIRAVFLENIFPRLRTSEISLPGLPPEQDGVKLLVLSDLHFNRLFQRCGLYRRLKALISREDPDLVLLLGDYVNRRGGNLPFDTVAEELSAFRGRYGAYAVWGNHEQELATKGQEPQIREIGCKAGLPMLNGRSAVVHLNGGRPAFRLCGATCKPFGYYELARAGRHSVPDLPVIALLHNPELWQITGDRVYLTLAGDTHGGQICLPFLSDIQRYLQEKAGKPFYGLYRKKGRQLIVTSGAGTTQLPLRWGRPSEAVLITLRSVPALTLR